MAEIRENLRLTDLTLEEANRVLGRLQDRIDALEGLRGTPRFYADMHLGSNKITNAAQGSASGEVLTADLDSQSIEVTGGNLAVKVASAIAMKKVDDGVAVKVKDGGGIQVDPDNGLFTEPFPVGAVFLSTLSDDPADLFGYGTWTAIGSGTLEIGDGWDGAGWVVQGGQGNVYQVNTTLYIWQRTA